YYSSKSNEIWDIQVEKQDTSRFYGRDQIWYKSQNGIYWIDHFDINEKLMEGPTFFFFDENFRLRQKLSAEKGVWNKGIWQLENAVVQTLDKNDRYTIERLDTFLLEIPEKPENFARRTKNPEDMSYQQLKRYTQNVKDEGYDNSIYLVDLYIKLAFPLISAVLGLIAVPIALGINRGGIPLAIALGIGICFLYLFTLSFSKSLGLSGTLPPLLSAWTSNLIFSMFGLHLIMNTNK
ncbi:MAG: LptF/LptG family permease, partial [Deltaproteobacteria bacterium]|nr:LptF/LptG family permease [Deltaproteobacteria bacterium]